MGRIDAEELAVGGNDTDICRRPALPPFLNGDHVGRGLRCPIVKSGVIAWLDARTPFARATRRERVEWKNAIMQLGISLRQLR